MSKLENPTALRARIIFAKKQLKELRQVVRPITEQMDHLSELYNILGVDPGDIEGVMHAEKLERKYKKFAKEYRELRDSVEALVASMED